MTILFFKEEQVVQLSGKINSFQYNADSGNQAMEELFKCPLTFSVLVS